MHSKKQRLDETFRRIQASPAPGTRDERLRQLEDVLNTVEDEMSGVPFNPDTPADDGRMYPPQADSIRDTDDPRVKRYRTRKHNVFISDDGAIEIQSVETGDVVFQSAGSNGKDVWS